MWVPVIKQLTLDLMRSRAGRTVPAVSLRERLYVYISQMLDHYSLVFTPQCG